jgi:hypothetical protein
MAEEMAAIRAMEEAERLAKVSSGGLIGFSQYAEQQELTSRLTGSSIIKGTTRCIQKGITRVVH